MASVASASEPNPVKPAVNPEPKPTPPSPALDLKPPDVTKLYTPEQLQQLLSKAVDPDMEEVEVEGKRNKPFTDRSLLRIIPSLFLPLSSEDMEQSKRYAKPDATFPYSRPPAAPPPGMAGNLRPYDR